eukprot:6092771-Ditylum_brightwellii.AAC.1
MKAMPNPLSNYEGQPDQIGMHSGFHSYLYSVPKRRSIDTDTDESELRNVCDTILAHIAEVLDAFPGYALYITGH